MIDIFLQFFQSLKCADIFGATLPHLRGKTCKRIDILMYTVLFRCSYCVFYCCVSRIQPKENSRPARKANTACHHFKTRWVTVLRRSGLRTRPWPTPNQPKPLIYLCFTVCVQETMKILWSFTHSHFVQPVCIFFCVTQREMFSRRFQVLFSIYVQVNGCCLAQKMIQMHFKSLMKVAHVH